MSVVHQRQRGPIYKRKATKKKEKQRKKRKATQKKKANAHTPCDCVSDLVVVDVGGTAETKETYIHN